MSQAQIEILIRRVDELQGHTKALEIALLLAFKRLVDFAPQSQSEALLKECAGLSRGLHQSADFYAGHAISTAISDAQIERLQKVLSDLASVLEP